MERYLDDFMGRYGHILPSYAMVPQPPREGGGEADAGEGSDAGPAPVASESSESSDGEGDAGGAGRRKRPRLSAALSGPAEDERLAPRFRRTNFRAAPTEGIDEFAGLWPHPLTT